MAGLCLSKSPHLRVWVSGGDPEAPVAPGQGTAALGISSTKWYSHCSQLGGHSAGKLAKGASGLMALGGILQENPNSAEICLGAPLATSKGQEALLWSGYFYSLFVNIFSSLELSIPYNFRQSTAVGNMFKIENTLRKVSEILCVWRHWLEQNKHSVTVILNYFKTVFKIQVCVSLELCPDMCVCLYLSIPQRTPGGQEERFQEARQQKQGAKWMCLKYNDDIFILSSSLIVCGWVYI